MSDFKAIDITNFNFNDFKYQFVNINEIIDNNVEYQSLVIIFQINCNDNNQNNNNNNNKNNDNF